MGRRDEELYLKHSDELIRFATPLVGPSLAEDVFSAAVIKAMTSPTWPAVTEPRAYLYRVVANEARRTWRSDQRRILREEHVSSAGASSSQLVSSEVLDAMRRLSLRERSVLFLAYWPEMSIAEIGAVLQISVRSVERALTQGRRQLEESLK